MALKFLPLFLVALLAVSCGSQKQTIDTTEPDFFIFGSGGGFTGKYAEYKIYDNGMIDEKNFKKDIWVAYAEVDPVNVKIFFTELNALQLMNFEYDHPGNLTWYIEVHDKETTNRVKWGDFNTPVRPELEAFFKRVNDYVLDLKQ